MGIKAFTLFAFLKFGGIITLAKYLLPVNELDFLVAYYQNCLRNSLLTILMVKNSFIYQ